MSDISIHKVQDYQGHKQPIYTIAYDRDKNLLYSSGADGMVIRWQIGTEAPGEVLMRLGNASFALEHSKNDYLITAENHFGLRIIDLKASKLVQSLPLGKHFYFDIYSNDDLIYVADNAGNLHAGHIHDVDSWEKHKIGTSSIRSIVPKHKTDELALCMSDNTVRIFDTKQKKELHQFNAHSRSVFSGAFMTDKPWLLTVGKDAQVRVWNTENEYKNAGEIPAHLYGINYISLSPDDKYFLTCSMDKTIKLWSTEEGKLLKVVDFARHHGHRTSINKVIWTDQNHFISSGDDRLICYWEIDGL